MSRLRAAGAALSLLACGSQYADPIVGSEDPCAKWITEAECRQDTRNVCTVQPNPVGCLSTDVNCRASACAQGDPFVRLVNGRLMLRERPFGFSGTNSWGASWAPECNLGNVGEPEPAITRLFDELALMHIGVLRVFAFQTSAGETGTDYANLERLVKHARRAGVRLIFVLENMRNGSCSKGRLDDAWFRAGFAAPYGGYALSYADYARGLVQHFKNEPTVLAWELLHEGAGDDVEALDHFVQQASALIRVYDSNHLIAAGLDGGTSPATSNVGELSNYRRLHAHDTIDLIDVHDFGSPEEALTDDARGTFAVALALKKAPVIGALAVELLDETPTSFALRASRVASKLDASHAHGFQGALVYDYYPGWSEPGMSFDSRPADPLGGANGVVARASARFRSY